MLDWLEEKWKILNPESTRDGSGGFTRLGFSKEEQLSINSFIHVAKDLGLTIKYDEIGNVSAIWVGIHENLPHIVIGSHLDTVKNGGGYDGVAGILAGLGVVKKLKSLNYRPYRSVEIICFISEESSRFGISTIGSKAIAGKLNMKKIKDLSDFNGITIQEALDYQKVRLTEIWKTERKKSDIHSFVELHIEQGTVLEDSNYSIGIVTGISGSFRYKIHIKGRANHSGATPMNNRRDALAKSGIIINFIERLGKNKAKNDQFVATVTTADVFPNVMNVIPDSVTLGVDIRSIDDNLKIESAKEIKEFCKKVKNNDDVEIEIENISSEKAVFLDEKVKLNLTKATKMSNQNSMNIVSGAGHDTMNMASKWPSGMIFIPCQNGVSHHPKEFAEISDIYNGIKVLINYIKVNDERM